MPLYKTRVRKTTNKYVDVEVSCACETEVFMLAVDKADFTKPDDSNEGCALMSIEPVLDKEPDYTEPDSDARLFSLYSVDYRNGKMALCSEDVSLHWLTSDDGDSEFYGEMQMEIETLLVDQACYFEDTAGYNSILRRIE